MTLQTTEVAPGTEVGLDVFVPVHGNLNLTTRCIEALYTNTKTPFHLIITDDGDRDKDLSSIFLEGLANRYHNVTLLHKPSGWKTGNEFFNAGFQHAQTDFIATVMNSVEVEPDWEFVPLDIMRRQPDVGIIGMKCIFPPGWTNPYTIESAGIAINGFTPIDIGRGSPGHRLCGVTEVPACQWAFALLRKQAVVGNLDPYVFFGHVGWDDIDNCLAVKKKGWKVLYCGMSVGYHSSRATRGSDGIDAAAKNLVNSHVFYKRNELWEKFWKTCPKETLDSQVAVMTQGVALMTGEDKERVAIDLAEFKKTRRLMKR